MIKVYTILFIAIIKIYFQLNLEKCQNNLIGIFGRKGISGGEKRRLSFASEVNFQAYINLKKRIKNLLQIR